MSARIDDLTNRVAALRSQLSVATKELHETMIAESGISVGDVVVSKGKMFRVVEIDPTCGKVSRPWLTGNPMKANGDYGTARRNLFDCWTKVEPDLASSSP